MKKFFLIVAVACMALSSCSPVSHIKSSDMVYNYGKQTENNPSKYSNVKVYMNENETNADFEVIAYGTYRPLIVIPILFPEKPRLEKNLIYKAVRRAQKLDANGVIIDGKNEFRVINTK